MPRITRRRSLATGLSAVLAALLVWLYMWHGGELFRWSPVRRRLVPRHIQRERARHRAHQTFLDLGLASTRDRTGILFFVSVAEHYIEIITDRGVSSVVDDSVWANTVAEFTAAVRQGRIADGVVDAVNACARVLTERLPPRAGDVNELPNWPLEL